MAQKNGRKWLLAMMALMLVALSCGLPGKDDGSSLPEGIDKNNPVEEIEIPAGQPVTLGGTGEEPVQIEIPADALPPGTAVSLYTLEEVEGVPGEGLTGIGTPITVVMDGEQDRSDEGMAVTLAFDPQGIEETGEVLVGYYHEDYGWYLFSPDQVDLANGTLTFTTYHFSTFSAFQADESKRIEQFLEKSAVEEYVRQTTGEQSNKVIEDMVKEIMIEGAGIVENHVLELVTKAVVKQLPYGETAVILYDLDLNDEDGDGETGVDDLSKKVLETALSALGKLIAEDDSVLEDITQSGSTIGAFASAAGSFSQGDIDGGLETMSGEILGNIPVISKVKEIGSDVVEIYNEVIMNVWYNPEMEKAFQVYKNGAEGGWLGYSVDAGNWDQLSVQMRGVFAKTRTAYIASYCNQRGIDPNSLSEEEHDRIGNQGMEKIHAQFDERLARQADIDQIHATQETLMEMFAEKGLLEEVIGTNPMYTGNEDLEMLMNRLMNMTEKVLADTGRNEVITNSFDENIDEPGTQIYAQDVVDLIWIWYVNQPDSEEAYNQALVEKGLIEDPNLICGVEPQLVTCQGDFTWILDASEGDVKTHCEFPLTFSAEFWNVGALGGEGYAAATLTYDNPKYFPFNNCELVEVNPYPVEGTFTGGPDGTIQFGVDYFLFELSSGSTGTLSTPNSDGLSMDGECTVANPEAFDGWKGP